MSTVGRVATELLKASLILNMVYSLMDLAVNYFCTVSVWWRRTLSTYKLRSIEQPSMQTTGVTIHTCIAGVTNSHPNKRGQTSLSPCPASHLCIIWMTPVLTYCHLTPFLDRHRENKHAYQLTQTRLTSSKYWKSSRPTLLWCVLLALCALNRNATKKALQYRGNGPLTRYPLTALRRGR